MKHLITITLLFFATITAGCGSGVRVGGKITLEDGTPLDKGAVVFDNGKLNFRGQVMPDGSYQLGVTRDAQKIPAGNYKVWIANTLETENYGREYSIYFNTIAGEYMGLDTSPLSAAVLPGGSQVFDFTLKPAADRVIKVYEDGREEKLPDDTKPNSGASGDGGGSRGRSR
ncbi:MAG: hypothetical protein LBT46_04530 [Planctomycetaceae bacterium]|jgi:hypothetical protein|nr:hypothetical protein [Planctomycetaceae bacterium]